jgi:hypothetical protein
MLDRLFAPYVGLGVLVLTGAGRLALDWYFGL